MTIAALFVNRDKDIGGKYSGITSQYLEKKGIKAIFFEKEREKEVLEKADMIISLGGDGTFLTVARLSYSYSIPMLGINLGSLGFLTDIDKNEITAAIDLIAEGKYNVEERMMISCEIIREGKVIEKDTALNDIVISRGAISRILHVKTYIDEIFIDNFPGDGLIISSPTGSTAYSLSAGGPIVKPDTKVFVVTPICPHILYSRSFITNSESEVKAVIDENYGHEAMVTVDGQTGYSVRGGDIIITRQAAFNIKLIKIRPVNFFSILRSKIYYRGEVLKKDEI